ncbi:MAG: tripartite tricarboxylate transporter substrate binding protein [Burkholderiales bacterium]|nr:tripartite tricarboxylate transporter substrate binding protein [Burkholderiales bacterium]
MKRTDVARFVAVLLLCVASLANAEYPERPIRIIVPFAPGGGTDILARMIGQRLMQAWGKQVVIDNRTGANGVIAAELTAKANPDGHTLLFVAIGHVINPLLQKKLPYDTEKDFTAVSMTAVLPLLLAVHPSLKAASVQELLALARARPQPLTYASGGVGSSQHLATALMGSMAGIKLNHVPYKGGFPGLVDLVAGNVEMMITSILAVVPHAKAGRLRMLAVSTAKRNNAVPEVPSIAEAGLPGYESIAWYGMVAPAGVAPAVLSKLSAEVVKSTRSPEMWDALTKQGADPVGSTPKEFSTFMRAETAKYGKLIKDTGMKAD